MNSHVGNFARDLYINNFDTNLPPYWRERLEHSGGMIDKVWLRFLNVFTTAVITREKIIKKGECMKSNDLECIIDLPPYWRERLEHSGGMINEVWLRDLNVFTTFVIMKESKDYQTG